MSDRDNHIFDDWEKKWAEFSEKSKNASDEEKLKYLNALLGAFPYVNLFGDDAAKAVTAVITYRAEYALYKICINILDDDAPPMSWEEFYHIIGNEEKLRIAAKAVILNAIQRFNWNDIDFEGPRVEVEFPPETKSDNDMIYMCALYPAEENEALAALLSFWAEEHHRTILNKNSTQPLTWKAYLEKTMSDEKQAQMLRDAVFTCIAKLDFTESWLSDSIAETKFLWTPPTTDE